MAAHLKRKLDEADPDYETLEDQEVKRLRAQEEDGRQIACKKVQAVIQREFQAEISNKERELQQVDMRLNEARLVLDRLRAVVVANYYGLAGQSAQVSQPSSGSSDKSEVQSIHPAVKKFIGKAPKNHSTHSEGMESQETGSSSSLAASMKEKECLSHETVTRSNIDVERSQSSLLAKTSSQIPRGNSPSLSLSQNPTFDDRRARLKIKRKIIVGNVSKYIPVDERELNDMSSHKWMVYVRGPKSDPSISYFVKRIWFFLHHSYKPNDLVEVSNPPFHLTRRGWGEFPVRVQLHFVDPRNKKVDIFHHLKLDKTFTGLQKLGGETVVEVELERDFFEDTQPVHEKTSTMSSLPKASSSSSSSSSSLQGVKQTTEVRVLSKSHSLVSSRESDTLQKSAEDSRTSGMLSADEIKQEAVVLSGNTGHSRSDSPKVAIEANREITSAQISNKEEHSHHHHHHPQQQQHQHTDINVITGLTSEEEVMSKGDENTQVEHCFAASSSMTSDLQNDVEYNVTIAHSSMEDEHVNVDHTVNVCDDEITSSGSAEKLHKPHQTGAFKLMHGISSKTAGAVRKILCPSLPVSPSSTLPGACSNNSSPRLNILSSSSPKQSPNSAVSQLSPQNSPRIPSSVIPFASFRQSPKPVHLIAASATSSSIKLEPLENGNIPFLAQVAVGQLNNTIVQSTSSVTNSVGTKVVNTLSTLKPSNVHQVKALSKASPSQFASPTNALILKTKGPHVQTGKVISRVDIAALSQSQSRNEDHKKNAMVVRVAPHSAQSQLVFLKPNAIKSSPRPTVVSAPSLGPQNSKKQVSLLTGLVVNPQKSVHSSNMNSLLRPGTCKFADGLNNHVSNTGVSMTVPMRSSEGGTLNALGNPTTMISKVPVKSNELAGRSVAVSIAPAPHRGLASASGIPLQSPASTSNSLLQQSYSMLESHRSVTDLDPLSFSIHNKMSAIGITKHKHLAQQRQAIAKMRKTFDLIEGNAEEIPPLNPEDYPDVRCLIKAAIKLHPLIQAGVNRLTHPYCAVTWEQWATWPLGKQRASEWHRACFVLKYIKACLGGAAQFKGEKLMSTRELVHWCRLHAFSPQSPIYDKRRNNNDDLHHDNKVQEEQQEEFSLQGDTGKPNQVHPNTLLELKSITKLKDVLTVLHGMEKLTEDEKAQQDFHVDVVGEEKTKRSISSAKEKAETGKDVAGCERIPQSEGAAFVNEWMRQRGIKFPPQELELGVVAHTAADMLFQSMLEFGADIVRKTMCVNAEQGRCTGNVSVKDVHRGLVALPEASFCGNKFLGKEDDEENDEDKSNGEKEIYR